MSRYWIADLHLGHAKVAELRGFEAHGFDDNAPWKHDETILGQLRALSPDDEVWILGDISSGRPEGEGAALEHLAFMPPRLHLIAGNHDSVSSTHRKGYTRQRRFLEVFESVQQFGRVRIHGQDVLMSHYPYARSGDGPDRGEARYLEYRLPDEGLPLIHGHTHQGAPLGGVWEPYRRDEQGRILLGWKPDLSQFCVSWDAHRRLVTEHDLNQWISGLLQPIEFETHTVPSWWAKASAWGVSHLIVSEARNGDGRVFGLSTACGLSFGLTDDLFGPDVRHCAKCSRKVAA